jgi:dihydroneopterin triphosphate diphosphatase
MEILSNMIEAHIFRENSGILEFLLLKRKDGGGYPGLWQMVNGKCEEGEKGYETALREIFEETGNKPEELWVVPNVNSYYSHEQDKIIILPVFAAKFDFNVEIKLSDEHVEYRWLSTEETSKVLAWAGQRKSVEIIKQYFEKELHFWNFTKIEF